MLYNGFGGVPLKTVLFINPPNIPFSSKNILIEPIDILNIATFISHNSDFNVEVLDMNVKEMMSHQLSKMEMSNVYMVVVVFDYHIPLHNSCVEKEVENISKIFKEKNIKTVLCGKKASFSSQLELQSLGFDFYISNDAEQPLLNILLGEKNVDLFDINNFPIPNRNLINLNEYIDVRTILSSRGCNLKCSFCHVPGFWGSWKGRNYKNVVDEIEMLVNNFQSKKILFLDDNALVDHQRMFDISKEIIERKIITNLGCLGSMNNFKEDMFESMYKSGFKWIHYGAESGDEKILKSIHKNFNINAKKIKNTVKNTQDLGFRVRTSWILDLPQTDETTIKKTEEAILEQNSEEIRLHFLAIRYGSELSKNKEITNQYIHNSVPNLTDKINEKIMLSLNNIIKELIKKDYYFIKNDKDIENIPQNKKTKVVSLCPLKYGIGWND